MSKKSSSPAIVKGSLPATIFNLPGVPLKSKLEAAPISQVFEFKFKDSYVDAEMKNCRGCGCDLQIARHGEARNVKTEGGSAKSSRFGVPCIDIIFLGELSQIKKVSSVLSLNQITPAHEAIHNLPAGAGP